MEDNIEEQSLNRTINWKQGLAIAIGVPLLILPSISTLAIYIGSLSIVLWCVSVIQGFFQNIAYGELATTFPKASGLPGFAQSVFGSKIESKIGKLIGGFSAWSYWLAWNPVLAIYSILISEFLCQLVPMLSKIPFVIVSLVVGSSIFLILIYVNSLGLSSSAKLGYILATISLIPLFVICITPYFTGHFNIVNITLNFIPKELTLNLKTILLFFGLMATAQWSACAWETAAIYGPEYKDPKSDILKALFSCGFICLVTFVFVQISVIGTLGIDFIKNSNISPLLSMATLTFGKIGSSIAIITLISSMILIIQTAFNGSSRSLYSMSREKNLPSFFGKLSKNGCPLNSFIFIAFFNLFLIFIFTFKGQNIGSVAILSASAFGYIFSNCISLYSYFKASTDSNLKQLKRHFKAPKFWKYIALFFSILNIPFYLCGIIYLNYLDFGIISILFGFIVLMLYFPLYKLARIEEMYMS